MPPGVDLLKLPDSCLTMLNEYATLWLKSGVEDLDEHSLAEAILERMRTRTENKLTCELLELDMEYLERDLEENLRDLEILEKTLQVSGELRNPENIKEQQYLRKQLEDLNKHEQQLVQVSAGSSVNLDSLIQKTQFAERGEARTKDAQSKGK
ncbi:hypothetical protein DMENIID0001_099760 [Sergentomyia squamirostris]